MNRLPLWPRIQLAKLHYRMGSLNKAQFVYMLGELFKEATTLRGTQR